MTPPDPLHALRDWLVKEEQEWSASPSTRCAARAAMCQETIMRLDRLREDAALASPEPPADATPLRLVTQVDDDRKGGTLACGHRVEFDPYPVKGDVRACTECAVRPADAPPAPEPEPKCKQCGSPITHRPPGDFCTAGCAAAALRSRRHAPSPAPEPDATPDATPDEGTLEDRLRAKDKHWQPRSERQLWDSLKLVCETMWNGKPPRGAHVWTIPVDPDRDFDCILADAIQELIERRRAALRQPPPEGQE